VSAETRSADGAVPSESFPRHFQLLVAAHPHELALVHVDPDGVERSFTWTELERRAAQVAGGLAARGVTRGNRVGIQLPNTPELVFATLASWKLGAVPVPVRWDLPDWELGRLREVVDAELHLDPASSGWIAETELDEVQEFPDVVSPNLNGICSSGSTGTPKVIVANRPAIYSDLYSVPMYELWGPVSRPQTILVLAPMYHTNGFATLYTLHGGDRLVIMQKFDAARILDVIERHRVTTFTATPTMLKRLVDQPDIDDRDLSSIEWILQGAAPMPPSLVERWGGLIGYERIVMAYGMTETIGLTALRGDEWLAHRGSVGKGIRSTEIRVLDVDQQPLPAGEIGDIYLRSGMYEGATYLGAGQLTPTGDGFYTVGDMGWLDDDGYLYLADRRVDLILSGGANVFPAEVETALIDHPAVADVVVIGLRDAEWGQRVHAVVALKPDAVAPSADEVIAFAKGRLAAYKVPKSVEFVDEIPRSAATKVNRQAMIADRQPST
jgi:bile acid-coenzyme A ligase